MGNGADTIFEGVCTGSHGDCCGEAVPLHDGTGYETLLDILFRFRGYVERHRVVVSGGSREKREVICNIQGYQSMNTFVKECQANVGSSLQ